MSVVVIFALPLLYPVKFVNSEEKNSFRLKSKSSS